MRINRDYLGCFGKLKRGNKQNFVVIHHTVTRSPSATRRALKAKGCSTHFEIDLDGIIYQYAELDEITFHCGSNNFQSIGVDITHMTDKPFPDVQLEAAHELFVYLAAKLDLPLVCYDSLPRGFYFHRAIGQTVCPGNLDMSIFNPDYKE